MDNKPPPRAWQWSTLSHSVCFLDLTTLLLIRFRHLYQFPIPFNQTMVQVRVQSLYSMASSLAHDSFRQEANPLHLLCVLKSSWAWRHLDVIHVPLVTRLYWRCSLKEVDFDLHTVCFSWTSGDAKGLGLLFMVCTCAVGLRGNRLTWMRGTWGVVWRSAHVPTIPFTWLRRAKALGLTAHASNHHVTRGLPMNAYVLYPMPIPPSDRSRKVTWIFWWRFHANESCDHFLALWLAKSNICCALIGYRLK